MIVFIRSDSEPQCTPSSITSPLWICDASSEAGLFCTREKNHFFHWLLFSVPWYFFIALVITDYYIFIRMAFDHYTGICKPSLPCYIGNKMPRCVYLSLVTAPYIPGFAGGPHGPSQLHRPVDPMRSTTFTVWTLPLLALTCSDTRVRETATRVGPPCLLKLKYNLQGLNKNVKTVSF